MRLAVVSAPVLKTPPDDYGGMEGRAWCLAQGLANLGHHVTLFAKVGSGRPGSKEFLGVSDSLASVLGVDVQRASEALATALEQQNIEVEDFAVGSLVIYEDERELPEASDGFRDKIDCWADFTHDKVLSSERPDLPAINNHQVMSLMGSGTNPVFISQGQKDEKFPGVEGPVIHYGLDLDEYPFHDGPRDDYLLYMGQIIPEKRIQTAIEAAVRANIRIRVCGPWWGPPEYSAELRKMEEQNPGMVSLEDSIGGAEKIEALQKARALIHLPGDRGWCEAGAIVVLEALAVGTPVICTPNGCLVEYLNVPESPGVLVTDLDDAVQAIEDVGFIRRDVCRRRIEEHFTQERFALEYEELAKRVADGLRWNT